MNNIAPKSPLMLLWSNCLNALRLNLRQTSALSAVRSLRLMIHFGPWRHVARWLIRTFRPASQPLASGMPSLLQPLDAAEVVAKLKRDSVYVAGSLDGDFVRRLRAITDNLPIDEYQLIHELDDDVRRLTCDPEIIRILTAYFGCNPVLLECTLTVTGPHRHGEGIQNKFHLDYAGWHSLNVFVYLSDVGAGSASHQVVRGSHKRLGIRDLMRATIPSSEIDRRFHDSIETITGEAGTLFFENTEALHRRIAAPERRVMLNMLFATHRSTLSYGRTSNRHRQRRDLIYKTQAASR